MKYLLLHILFLILAFPLCAQELESASWNTGEENTIIETYQKDGMWFGRILSSDSPEAKIGKDILQGFKFEDGEWKGKLFAAKKGKLLNAVMAPNDSELKITVSAGMFKRKISWEKVDP